MKNKILLYVGLALLAGFMIGLYPGYKIGFAVRDYEAAKEMIAQDEIMRDTNAELQELRLRLALVNANLAGLTRDLEWRFGLGGDPRPSEED